MNRLLEYIENNTEADLVVSEELFKRLDMKVNVAATNYKRHNSGCWINLGELPKANCVITTSMESEHCLFYDRCHPIVSFAIMPARATGYLIDIKPNEANAVYIILNDNYLIPANVKVVSLTNIHDRLTQLLKRLQKSKSLDHFHDLIKNP
jgi:hypothetical protein